MNLIKQIHSHVQLIKGLVLQEVATYFKYIGS